MSSMPQLNYLDDAPVGDHDRRLAAAFIAVGVIASDRIMKSSVSRQLQQHT